MRILIFNWRDVHHPRAGGAEVYTHEVARNWVAARNDVTLFTSEVGGRQRREVVDGIRVIRAGDRFSVYRMARKFWAEEGGSSRFDVVIDEVNTRPFACPRFIHDVPVVALIHQVAREVWWHEFFLPAAAVGRFVLEPRWLSTYTDVPVMTVSQSTKDSLRAYGVKTVQVFPQGLSLPELPGPHEREPNPTIVWVGRLSPNKRPHHALAAFARVRRSIPNAQLWMIGTGPMREKLERRATDGGEFLGWLVQRGRVGRI